MRSEGDLRKPLVESPLKLDDSSHQVQRDVKLPLISGVIPSQTSGCPQTFLVVNVSLELDHPMPVGIPLTFDEISTENASLPQMSGVIPSQTSGSLQTFLVNASLELDHPMSVEIPLAFDEISIPFHLTESGHPGLW